MSYCRFAWGGSDVYVFESSEGIECCGCRFGNTFTAGTEEEMIAHLGQHRRAGHFVPPHAVEGLWHAIPGATKPDKPEPIELTLASLQMSAISLQCRIREMEEAAKGTGGKEERTYGG